MSTRTLRLNSHEVKAIRDGRQTQLRRVVECYCNCMHLGRLLGTWALSTPPYQPNQEEIDAGQWQWRWPGNAKPPKPGDWIECYQTDVDDDAFAPVWNPFACDLLRCQLSPTSGICIKPTRVRVERIQDISEADAIAEGIQRNSFKPDEWIDYPEGTSLAGWTDPRHSYRSLWYSINGREIWDANPWVWVVEFERIQP